MLITIISLMDSHVLLLLFTEFISLRTDAKYLAYVLNVIKHIGNTPLIKYNDSIFVKLEYMNYSGSIKDRPVSFILNKAEKAGKIRPGWTVLVEATSGNTGIALATLGKLKGYAVKIIMPEDMSEERKKIITALGAEITYVPPGAFLQAIELRDQLCKEYPNYYNFNQFGASENIEAHYKGTAKEIVKDIQSMGLNLSGFVCGTGTGGTYMGVSKRLRNVFKDVKCAVVEPAESAVMSGGQPGLHYIQGIGDGSKYLVDLKKVDKIYTVKSEDALNEAKAISKEFGYFVGISSGANLLAAKRMVEEYGGPVVTIFCDNGNRYLSMF